MAQCLGRAEGASGGPGWLLSARSVSVLRFLVDERAGSEHKPHLLPLQLKEWLEKGMRAFVLCGHAEGDLTPSLLAVSVAFM